MCEVFYLPEDTVGIPSLPFKMKLFAVRYARGTTEAGNVGAVLSGPLSRAISSETACFVPGHVN